MNKNRLYLMIGAAFFCQQAMASESLQEQSDLLTAHFPEICNFSGEFVQQKEVEGLPVPLESEGDFFYSCDLGLIWSTNTPFKEAIVYVNSVNNYRVEEDGTLAPLTGIGRYIMSHVFVRLLKGDAEYFVEEFSISQSQDKAAVVLTPESDFMKKGIDTIRFKKTISAEQETALSVDILDATKANTHLVINHIKEYKIAGKRRAFEQCEERYENNTDWCQLLLSPSRIRR